LKNQRLILIQLLRFQGPKEPFLIDYVIWLFFDLSFKKSDLKRGKALLPSAQLISVLLEPGERAYSWYQHQKAHTIETALQHSFYEVITSEPGTPEYSLRQVRMQVRIMTHPSFQRCLEPGLYARHLSRWFERYSGKQMIILDGNKLKSDPIPLLNRLQKQLKVETPIDFKKIIKYDEKKGFFCPLENGKTKCLGKSKVRVELSTKKIKKP